MKSSSEIHRSYYPHIVCTSLQKLDFTTNVHLLVFKWQGSGGADLVPTFLEMETALDMQPTYRRCPCFTTTKSAILRAPTALCRPATLLDDTVREYLSE
mmetsp:Transcript_27351/g.67922  ORF Transcript_27351/g.67922 Transcript_27351/m.67922 type:complete len:99 (-) Transcript_27351:316-612(-)